MQQWNRQNYEEAAAILAQNGILASLSTGASDTQKISKRTPETVGGNTSLYGRSLRFSDGAVFAMATSGGRKYLLVAAEHGKNNSGDYRQQTGEPQSQESAQKNCHPAQG